MTDLARGLGWFVLGAGALGASVVCVRFARALVVARRWRRRGKPCR